tara:strand:+ start:685 stop:1215 length:531 start_codon:yes stop_codon:yes gene_type:complete
MRLVIVFLLLTSTCFSSRIIQLKDFLCGCDYCVTVPTQEPLDIGRHMIMCHSSREATLKTMEIMRQTKKPKVKEKKEIAKSEQPKQESAIKEWEKQSEHQWKKDIDGSWLYSTSYHLIDSWLYREDAGWLWSFNKGRFFFSEKYGWLYNYMFRQRRLFYWYDRRVWILPRDLPNSK